LKKKKKLAQSDLSKFVNLLFFRSIQVEFVANPRIDHVCLSLNTSKTPQLRPNRIEPELSQSEKWKKRCFVK